MSMIDAIDLNQSQRAAIQRMVKSTPELSLAELAFGLLLIGGLEPADLIELVGMTPPQVQEAVASVMKRVNANESALRKARESPPDRSKRKNRPTAAPTSKARHAG